MSAAAMVQPRRMWAHTSEVKLQFVPGRIDERVSDQRKSEAERALESGPGASQPARVSSQPDQDSKPHGDHDRQDGPTAYQAGLFPS